ncbi:uncharacterized protein N7479_010749 [Penicillium vulpinum]|uniref:Uncharacterized protein n=1 Tax=Penicillium vulpinum TaxID=29845 RepID=A0A1V6RZW6_9EURO|nr:uncharacterized protein N7479_010749 [Penicillium vulpinum]KAJ5952336.1 hypothetical protein N7479_010749 [Penicillium vulpinum]OQE07337.1 hypothetical protein PENVUL_c014G05759 [Penicillium vulpinum]
MASYDIASLNRDVEMLLTDLNRRDQGFNPPGNGNNNNLAAAPPGATHQSPAEPPGVHQNGSDTIIPAAISGTANHPPGALAAHIKRLDFPKAHFRKSDRLKSDALEDMSLMPAQRDPVLRSEKTWTGPKLDRIIGESLDNIESALQQVVGVRVEPPCLSCLRGHGPWNSCVLLESNSDITACAGCHFRGNDVRCTYYRPPPPDTTERDRRDREIEDLREEINRLQQRSTEMTMAIDETRQTMKVLREATQGGMAADETRQTMTALAETLRFHNQQVSQARADAELLGQRHQELRTLIREAEQLQQEENKFTASTDSRRRQSHDHSSH